MVWVCVLDRIFEYVCVIFFVYLGCLGKSVAREVAVVSWFSGLAGRFIAASWLEFRREIRCLFLLQLSEHYHSEMACLFLLFVV